DGFAFPTPEVISADVAQMRSLGIDTIRTYELPPPDLLDAAHENKIRLLIGLHHHDWRTEPGTDRAARRRIRSASDRAVDEALALVERRPEVMAIAVGNEIPVDLVRLHGRSHVERTLTRMVDRLNRSDPGLLTTYVNYPTTEFLEIANADIVSFNVFLEDRSNFGRYLQHLQLISRDRPLLLTELGLAAGIHGEQAQADLLATQLVRVDELGVAGAFIFAWTDDWAVAEHDVSGWEFGITEADRTPKRAASVVSTWSNRTYPKDLRREWPRVSVVVCAYNEEATIGQCLDSLLASSYPDLEVILCDDGSTDATAEIAITRGVRPLDLDHGGLSRARNAGLQTASGSIVAYLDADAACHPDWPYHLALSMEEDVAATGGPNLPFADTGLVERAIAHVPGQASEVLLGPGRAEHVPGCNMAFSRDKLTEIGGFDVRYVAAGDDVDVCWKLLDRNYEIGFSPAAQVDHHRRATVRGFLRQQRGYGRAERMLGGPHRHRLNGLGQARWRGFVYGPARLVPWALRSVVYTGWAGTAPFQPIISHRAELATGYVSASLPVVAALGLAAAIAAPLLPAALVVGAICVAWLIGVGVASGRSARLPHTEPTPNRLRFLVGLLTVLQPLARTWGRVTGKVLAAEKPHPIPWNGDRLRWLSTVERSLLAAGLTVRHGPPGAFWDLEVGGRGPVVQRLRTATVWGWEPRWSTQFHLRRTWLIPAAVLALVAVLAGPMAAAIMFTLAVPLCAIGAIDLGRQTRAILIATTNPSRLESDVGRP
ncbi:MAG: glycosyltransferase, partial [Acidimicrobiales bacterium]